MSRHRDGPPNAHPFAATNDEPEGIGYSLSLDSGGNLTTKGANNHILAIERLFLNGDRIRVGDQNNLATISGSIAQVTGATTLTTGSLFVTGSLGNTTVTAASATTLGGTGSFGGPVTVEGTLAPGATGHNSTGHFVFENALTLATTANTQLEIDRTASPTHDALNITGTFTAGGTLAITSSPEFQGEQSTASFTPSGPLAPATTYYCTARVYLRNATTNLGIGASNSGAGLAAAPVGTPFLVVGRFTLSTTANSDTLDVWVNPSAEPTGNSTLRLTGFTAPRTPANSAGNFLLYSGYSAQNAIDEIALATSYADVTSNIAIESTPLASHVPVIPTFEFQQRKHGLFVHYVFGGWMGNYTALGHQQGYPTTIDQLVNAFDVNTFANQVASMGVEYLIFTAYHANMNVFYPSTKMANWRGPEHATTSRDLLGEICDAMALKGIKVHCLRFPADSMPNGGNDFLG